MGKLSPREMVNVRSYVGVQETGPRRVRASLLSWGVCWAGVSLCLECAEVGWVCTAPPPTPSICLIHLELPGFFLSLLNWRLCERIIIESAAFLQYPSSLFRSWSVPTSSRVWPWPCLPSPYFLGSPLPSHSGASQVTMDSVVVSNSHDAFICKLAGTNLTQLI